MNILEELFRAKEQLLKKKRAAQSLCNAPMALQFQILLEEIEKKIAEVKTVK